MLMPASRLYADWKIVTRTGDRTVTEFFKGALMRTDPAPNYTTVSDFEQRRQVNWRTDLGQYSVVEWPPEALRESASGPVIQVERSTTDTGERKEFFGHSGRHLITRTRRSDGLESMIDGWYIDAPGLPKWKNGAGNAVGVLTMSVAGQKPAIPRIEVKQTGPAPQGLVVWQRMTTTIVVPGGAGHSFDTVSEVIDLVEGPLSDKIFRQPDGYQRVANLPAMALQVGRPATWAEVIRAHWQRMEDWISGLFAASSGR
jgi:hypothetical protein